jgi:hypothetical protein
MHSNQRTSLDCCSCQTKPHASLIYVLVCSYGNFLVSSCNNVYIFLSVGVLFVLELHDIFLDILNKGNKLHNLK